MLSLWKTKTQLTNEAGIPVGDNQNSRTAGPRGPELLEMLATRKTGPFQP